jgi:flavin-dependent dehydrogenase
VQFETPAYSIPRYTLDEALWKGANGRGVDCRYETVQDVAETIDGFRVSTAKGVLHSKTVINASGRWSKLSRREGDESWIGLKAHFQGPTDDLVHLYFAKGTYCGVQAAAPGVVNACALVRQGVARDLKQVFQLDPDLAASSESWKPITETFATAPVYLGPGDAIASGMLQVGDAAGFVDPFVGDGISLALRTGVLAGRCACSVSQERYAELYRHSFANIFSSAGRARSLLRLVTPMPRMLHALRLPQLGKKIFESTRRANLDVLQCSIS